MATRGAREAWGRAGVGISMSGGRGTILSLYSDLGTDTRIPLADRGSRFGVPATTEHTHFKEHLKTGHRHCPGRRTPSPHALPMASFSPSHTCKEQVSNFLALWPVLLVNPRLPHVPLRYTGRHRGPHEPPPDTTELPAPRWPLAATSLSVPARDVYSLPNPSPHNVHYATLSI